MHDMSNTRKEIAARLGFAAGSGAKEAKAALDAWRLAVQKEEAYLGSVFVNPMKQREVEARTQAAYELAKRLNPDYQGFSRPGAKTRMTRDQTEEQKAGLKIMSAADPAVGAKIAKLIKEGKPQDQAVAIALDMKRRGEL